jgi:arylsulfatase A-like enzyme
VVNTWSKINQNNIVLDDSVPTLSEILRSEDFVTASIDNMVNFASHPKWFVRGYQYYINPKATPYHPEINLFTSRYRRDIVESTDMVTADEINQPLIECVKNFQKKKFMLFAHYWDPHGFSEKIHSGGPFEPKEFKNKYTEDEDLEYYDTSSGKKYIKSWGLASFLTSERQRRFNLYDCTIAYLDNRLGRVFQTLKDLELYDDTLIIVTADHGTWEIPLGRTGFPHLAPSRIHIPLIIKPPIGDYSKNKIIDAYVQPPDVLPTILNLFDYGSDFTCRTVQYAFEGEFESPTGVDGISLLPLMKGEESEIRKEVFGTVVSSHCSRSIMTDEWKLITHFYGGRKPFLKKNYRLPLNELYNLIEDPEELIEISQKNPDIVKELQSRIQIWIDENLKKSGKSDPIYSSKMVDYGSEGKPIWI